MRPHHSLRSPLAALLLALVAAPSIAAEVHVCLDGSGDATTIAGGFALAAPGDAVVLCPGTYTEHDLVLPPAVSLRSASNDAADTIIDAAFQGRCLVLPAGGAAPVTAITFRNGTDPVEGGLVLVTGTGANFHRCVFQGGSAASGGAVYTALFEADAPHFVDCTFDGNEAASGGGGAIHAVYFVSATGSVFRHNTTTGDGGAVHHADPVGLGFAFHDCAFDSNMAAQGGGAIYSAGSYTDVNGSELYRSVLTGNQALYGGAMMYGGLAPAVVSVEGNRFLGNFAGQWGGAIFLDFWEEPKDGYPFTDCVFARNFAGEAGGAIVALNGFAADHCTFVDNSSFDGGHVYSDPNLQLDDCILAFAPFGGAVGGNGNAFLSCTDVHGNGGGDWTGLLAGQDGVGGNFALDPLFCDAPGGDYTLRADSPCAAPGVTSCGLIGAEDVGCGPVPVREETWAGIKARYREGDAR